MSLLAERLHNELQEVRLLALRSEGRIKLLSPGHREKLSDKLLLELRYRTSGDSQYPERWIDHMTLTMFLPARYPRESPRTVVSPVIFHPHVFSNGQFCARDFWTGGCNLVTYLERITKLITYEPSMINLASPANAAAATWYRSAVVRHPHAFPTESVVTDVHRKPKVVWNDA